MMTMRSYEHGEERWLAHLHRWQRAHHVITDPNCEAMTVAALDAAKSTYQRCQELQDRFPCQRAYEAMCDAALSCDLLWRHLEEDIRHAPGVETEGWRA
jgi:hypothetical protein